MLLFRAVNQFPANGYLISEFSMGNAFRADFVALSGYSGGFDVEFIELEPVDAPLFNKKGTPSKRLNGAVAQVTDWHAFLNSNRAYVAQQLSLAVARKELLWPRLSRNKLMCNAGLSITDPRVCLGFQFHIFIGRSSELSTEDVVRKTSLSNLTNLDVATYDRFVGVAKDMDTWASGL